MSHKCDIAIIGGGPAGLSAGIYAARDKRDTILIEKGMAGGLIAMAEHVENYPGFPEGVSGFELGEFMNTQAARFGMKTVNAEVTGLEIKGKEKVVKTTEGDITAKAVIIASGSEPSKLNVPGESEFTGRGVSYCATCDAAFFQDGIVAVVGGGDVAISDALHLARFASKVYIIHRRDQLRATRVLQDRAFAEPKVEMLWSSTVKAIEGKDLVEKMRLNRVKTGEEYPVEVNGVFIAVGFKPNTEFLKGIIPLDKEGRIPVNALMQTGVPGVFAAGDIRSESVRQVVAAAGDGAVAAINAIKYLSE